MNRWIIGFGLLLLVLSAVFFTYANKNYVTPEGNGGVASSNDPSEIMRWQCAGNFTKDDVIEIELLPNIFWAQNSAAFDVVDLNGTTIPVLYVDVNITDPLNSVSQYELWLIYDQSSNRFSVYNTSALSFGDGISSDVLLPNNYSFPYTFWAGSAKLNGTYLADVVSAGWPYDYRASGTYPPATLELFYERTTLKTSKLYENLLYPGCIMIPVGILFIVYGSKIKTKTRQKAPNRN